MVLPGFGSLEVKEVSGGVSKSGSKIHPPGLTVKYNKAFSKDDGVLAAFLAAGEGVQEEEARQRVLELIDAIKFSLDKGESYTLLETGTLWKDDDGKVHFQQVSDWVLEPEQYGLDSLDLLELDELPIEEEKPDDIQLDIPAPPVRKQAVRSSVRSPRDQAEEKSSRRMHTWRILWIIAAVLVVVLVTLILIPSGGKKAPVEVIPQIQNQQEEAQATSPVQEAEQPKEEVEASGSQPVEEVLNFHIIAGSFKHLKNASDKQDELKARGFQAEMMITENRMYRVSVGSFASEREAANALSGLKSEPGLESCWILSN